jgi:hypothetical protein
MNGHSCGFYRAAFQALPYVQRRIGVEHMYWPVFINSGCDQINVVFIKRIQ